jgi:hypothetical protein
MKKTHTYLCAVLCAGLTTATSQAAVGLFEYGFNIDGVISPPAALPPGVSLAAFDTATGLGSVSVSIASPGAHYFGAYFDHEIDEAVNTFFNEFGWKSGDPDSWEIDEPGFRDPNPGDIYDNFVAGALDNSNGVPQGSEDDVAMALAWDFALAPGEKAKISLTLGTAQPPGFFLAQVDPESFIPGTQIPYTLYYSGTLKIFRPDNGIPDAGSTALSLLAALGSLAAFRGLRRR